MRNFYNWPQAIPDFPRAVGDKASALPLILAVFPGYRRAMSSTCSTVFKARGPCYSIIALAAALASSPALASQDYPPGLFENSPVVPSGPPDATVPSDPSDAAAPFGPPNAVDPLDDYCADLESRTFRSLAEVRQAHARCDPARNAGPPNDE
ncbi:MAG: hypothetical protein WBQ45_11395 [Roseiarcus sp.]|jgi:hypothetical protein|uniref:hypothetical protein n=2 Tax=Roseiarcus sp. TaxID=1969460 RepID=UPI003C33E4CB